MSIPAGLRTEQAPPLAVPMAFFLLAPLALCVAGVLLLCSGTSTLISGWLPATLGATHVGTLGLLTPVMFGALYQMTPVVAGSPVPVPRLAHLVFVAQVIGVVALVSGLWLGRRLEITIAIAALGTALVIFALPVGIALARAPVRSNTVRGMRLAVLALVLLGTLGLRLASMYVGFETVDRSVWIEAHAALGLVCWVGGLIASVSWQVLPMFYLTAGFPSLVTGLTLASLALTMLAALLMVQVELGSTVLLALLAPGALAVFVAHPFFAWRLIRQRKRRRRDASLDFWRAGLALGPLVAAAAVVATLDAHPRWPLLCGWLAIWGWAGLIVHGMLTRIVPFLIWFHRFSSLRAGGPASVPPMRRILPDARAMPGLALHALGVVAGAAAIVTGWSPLATLAGAAFVGAGVGLALAICRALLVRG